MSAGPFTLYTQTKVSLLEGKISIKNNTLKVVLVKSSYTPAITTDATYADISSHEASGEGYTAGGQWLTGVCVKPAGNGAVVTWADSTWVNSTITAKYAVIVEASSTPNPTDMILGYIDLNVGGSDLSSTIGDFQVDWNVTSIFGIK